MNIRYFLVTAVAAAGVLAACGKSDAPAPQPTATPAPAPAPAAPTTAPAPAAPPAATTAAAPAGADLEQGKSVYGKACAMCHAAGVGGAPKPGDKADWGPRIAQGNDVLFKHAIAGFTGQKGLMPPKGGNVALSDDEVKAAVAYMIAQ